MIIVPKLVQNRSTQDRIFKSIKGKIHDCIFWQACDAIISGEISTKCYGGVFLPVYVDLLEKHKWK